VSRYLLVVLREDLAKVGTTHNTAVLAVGQCNGVESVTDLSAISQTTLDALLLPPDQTWETWAAGPDVGETEREYAWRIYPNDARGILQASEAPTARCKQSGCRAPIWWGVTRANTRRCPFDIRPDGTRTATSHWRTCRNRPGRKEN